MKMWRNLVALLIVTALATGCSAFRGVNEEPDLNNFDTLVYESGWRATYIKKHLTPTEMSVEVRGERCRAILRFFPVSTTPNPAQSASPATPFFKAIAVEDDTANANRQTLEGVTGFEKKNPTPNDFTDALSSAKTRGTVTIC